MQVLDEVSERGVTERRFDLPVDDRIVPGIVWTPSEAQATALVLVGHGYTLHKRTPYVLSLARRLVRHHAIAAVAIDGPEHGDRQTGRMWWTDERTDATIADWKATLAAARALSEIGPDVPVGYWGFSMGTIFGLPFVASEPDIRVAVLGLMGLVGPTRERMELAAKSVASIPILFCLQRDDELVPLAASIEMFDALATPDKRLHLNPGVHAAVPVEQFEATEAFLAKHLVP